MSFRSTALLAFALLGTIPRLDPAEDDLPPTREEIAATMGLPSDGDRVRGQKDTVGFVKTREQAEDLFGKLMEDEAAALAKQDEQLGMKPEDVFLGGVCPHDDHLYAGRLYLRLTERITAPRVILLGVFHRARLWNEHDRLVFDAFESWHGPWGGVPVDGLREELTGALPADAYVADNARHEIEHSVEAIVPFLQHRNRAVRIVPILVPYMGWDRLVELDRLLAKALADVMKRNGWQLGRDVAIIASSDAVHYGPDFGHAPFGTDLDAYRQAVERDVGLATETLCGGLVHGNLHELFRALVDQEDVRVYRIPWCGRFSVPFGMELLRRTAHLLGDREPTSRLLGYGTSLSEAEPAVSEETRRAGLGTTAPSNLHHWVGYPVVGVWQPHWSATSPVR